MEVSFSRSPRTRNLTRIVCAAVQNLVLDTELEYCLQLLNALDLGDTASVVSLEVNWTQMEPLRPEG
jgi:hypothetical protein